MPTTNTSGAGGESGAVDDGGPIAKWSDAAEDAAREALDDAHRKLCSHYDCCYFQGGTHGALNAATTAQFAPAEEQRAFVEAVRRVVEREDFARGDLATMRSALTRGVLVLRGDATKEKS